MSYARWGWVYDYTPEKYPDAEPKYNFDFAPNMAFIGKGGSSVYVFGTTVAGRNVVECCGCSLTELGGDGSYTPHLLEDEEQIREHFALHEAKGDVILDGMVEEIIEDKWYENAVSDGVQPHDPPEPLS